jgi:hypothetical protein
MENENFGTMPENVEQTTEQSPKTYTEAEFNAKLDEVLGKKIARREAKIRREYERKYGELEDVLKAGTGKEDVGEITNTFRDYYTQKGIAIKERPVYSEKDDEVLARADAEDIIRSGYDEVVYETDRLTRLGAQNMTARDKVLFKVLADHRQNAERQRELAQMGVTTEEYESKDFKDFAAKFSPTTPVRDIYDIYSKTKPKKEIKTMGSMTSSESADNGVKEYYSFEEARKFTKKDFDENPALYKSVLNSIPQWKK